jgi:hypothetical protein
MLILSVSSTPAMYALSSITRSLHWMLISSMVLFRALLPTEHSSSAGAKSDAAMGITLLDSAASNALTIPLLAAVIEALGWHKASLYLGTIGIIAMPACWLWLVSSLVQRAKDEAEREAHLSGVPQKPRPPLSAKTFLAPLRMPAFHAMLGMFFICGITSIGVAETHLIFWATDQGMSTLSAASLAATKTFVNSCSLFLASLHTMYGQDPSRPLAIIYFMRSVSYVLATYAHTPALMYAWAISFGMFDYATQPYTVALLRNRCGADAISWLFSLLLFSHSIGYNVGSLAAARVRDVTGSFDLAFLGCAAVLLVASLLAHLTPAVPPKPKVLGLTWKKTFDRPKQGAEVANTDLQTALESGKVTFTPEEVARFAIDGLTESSFIVAGAAYYVPLYESANNDLLL